MTKKLSWLDKFAEEQAKKMTKTASLKKQAEQIVIDTDELPEAFDGQEVIYKDATYKVVNANFSDEVGPGIILEKINNTVAELEEEVEIAEETTEEVEIAEETTEEVEIQEVAAEKPEVTQAPEKAVQPDQGNDNLHIEVRDTVEIDKFQEEAMETEEQVELENSVDRTTPEGKYNRIETKIQEAFAPQVECEEFVDADEDGLCDDCGLPEEECPAEEKTITSNRIFNKLRLTK